MTIFQLNSIDIKLQPLQTNKLNFKQQLNKYNNLSYYQRNMGNADISGYSEGCYGFFKNLPQTHQRLRILYKKQYAYTEFGRLAIDTLRNFRLESDFNPMQAQDIRKSMIDSSHYQLNTLNQPEFLQQWAMKKQKPQALPASFNSFDQEQKQRYLRKLIKESYILVDLSDILEGGQRQAYQKQIKQQIFESDPSLLQSMIITKKDTEVLIKSFHPAVIGLLQDYVHFCNDVNDQFLENHDCFYFKLLLNIKAHIIQKNKYMPQNASLSNARKIQILKQDINSACKIMMDTIYTQHQMLRKTKKRKTGKGQYIDEQSDNKSVSFYEQANIHTLIMSIIFSDASFTHNIVQFFMNYYSQQLKKFKQGSTAKAQLLLKALKNTNSKLSKTYSSKNLANLFENGNNLQKLFQGERNQFSSQNLFRKSVKMFNALHEKMQPIFRLKILFQINKTLQKQFRQVFRQHNINSSDIISYNRQAMSLIAKWMLHREKNTAAACENIIFLLMTYWFIHDGYRESQKGSCLIPFVQQCQRILEK